MNMSKVEIEKRAKDVVHRQPVRSRVALPGAGAVVERLQ